jgi:hypothetical protein
VGADGLSLGSERLETGSRLPQAGNSSRFGNRETVQPERSFSIVVVLIQEDAAWAAFA